MRCSAVEILTEIRDRFRNLDTLEEKRAVKAAQQARYRERLRQANAGGRRSCAAAGTAESAAAGTAESAAADTVESAAARERSPPWRPLAAIVGVYPI